MAWLDDLERRAYDQLEWYVRDYFGASAGSAEEYRATLAEWDAVTFRPRALRGPKSLDLSTTVLGQPVSSPILVAPMAQQVAADPRGELATAEAVRGVGSLLGVSTNTAVPFDELGATGAPWWFQLYLFRERPTTEMIVARAVAGGATALMLTVDTTALIASRPGIEPTDWPDVPGRVRLANLTPEEYETERSLAEAINPGLDDIAWLAEISGLPIVVKGILRADDATDAVDAGASAIVVSTHGGRRLGRSISSLRALPEVVHAVGERTEVLVDSGIRSGSHVLAALALGARAVFVGRPVMWGLTTGGAAGVTSVLERLNAELILALDQSGVAGIDQLSPDLVRL